MRYFSSIQVFVITSVSVIITIVVLSYVNISDFQKSILQNESDKINEYVEISPVPEKKEYIESSQAIDLGEYSAVYFNTFAELNQIDGSSEYTYTELNNIRIYERLNRGVVNIKTETVSLNWFLEPIPREGDSGSGSIIDKRGYVLTNYHVVRNAVKVFITFHDGTQFEGDVIGKDPETDLAVIRFDPQEKELAIIPFGSSKELKVGQKVLAIGNPFGYDRTLTTGIVSGLGRPIRTSRNLVIRNMIQTDASINPGNSGGPLLDGRGTMVGINTVIHSPTGGSIGIGFAVPIDTARRVVPELINHGRVSRGWIDITPVQLDSTIVRYGNLPVNKGILVSEVASGGKAESAGIQGGDKSSPVRYGRSTIYFGGDIIKAIDSIGISTFSDLFSVLEDKKPGDQVTIKILRNNRELTFRVTLSERPAGIDWG